MPPRALADPAPHLTRFTLFGLGWSGVSAANLLISLGKQVTATDTRAEDALRASLAALEAQHGIALDPRVQLRCGQPHRATNDSDAVALTQSVKPWEEPVLDAQRRGLPVIPEVELAAGALAGLDIPLIAIGGTDGKTTTVKLAGHLASAARRAWIGGNSWTPLSARVMDAARELADRPLGDGEQAAMIAEISAFQLPAWHGFHPRVAALTNIAEDHVDEYFRGSFDAYAAAKRALTDRLGPGDLAVLNVDDPRLRAFEPAILARGARVLRVSLSARPVADAPDAAFRHNGQLRLRWGGRERALLDQHQLPLLGDHNVENALTAIGALAPLDLPPERLRDGLLSFRPPHHRLERVGLLRGVEVFDDSKATNVHAALAGLSAFGARPLVVIAGGVDKNLSLDAWAEALRTRARAVVVIGQLRERVSRELPDLPGLRLAASLEEAAALALDAAQPGDALVLSPACSSFDMFEGYAQRGEAFQAIIRQKMLTEA